MGLIQRSNYWRKVNPRGAIADFREVYRQAGSNRWRIGALAAATTFAIFSVIAQEGGRGLPQPPKVTYITTYAPDRTDAEIVASNERNQHFKDRLAAENAAVEERRREMYKTLGRLSGMDVDAIEKKAQAERAAEAAAEKAKADALTARQQQEATRQAETANGGAAPQVQPSATPAQTSATPE